MTSRPSHTTGERFKDRVCLITGGSRGIGRGCVRVFARNGAKVAFCALDADEGKIVEKEVNERGPGEAVYIGCDVTKEDEIKSMIEETVARFGRIDCLVNNAGAHPHPQLIDDTTADAFRDLFDLNVLGYFLTSKYALPHIRKTEGCIINISSLVAQIGQPGAIPYVATKGAVSAMTRAMAIDEAVYNVRVNSISPGNIWTPMWEEWASSSANKEKAIQEGVQAQLLGRMGTPEEAGELCLYLAAEATFLTGVDIPLSGGAELNYGSKSRRESADGAAAAAV